MTVPSLPVQTVTVTQSKFNIGISENNDNSIQIYPNPTRGIFKVVPGRAGIGAMDITVQDLNGKVIMKRRCKGEKENQIDISTAPQGAYHIIIKTDTDLLVRKLVVMK